MSKYRHTQIGYVIIIPLAAAIFLVFFLLKVYSFNWIAVIVLAILLICLFLFPSLTVEIDDEFFQFRFGPGFIRMKLPVKDIVSARAVRNRWYYGWGIRLTPHGWLYNVSGLDAVELKMRSGKIYRIGTDEPETLRQAIEEYSGSA